MCHMCIPCPGIVLEGEIVGAVDEWSISLAAVRSLPDGVTANFLLFGRWGKESSEEMLGRQRV